MYAYCVREFSKKTAVSHDRAGSGMSKYLIMSINKSKNAKAEFKAEKLVFWLC